MHLIFAFLKFYDDISFLLFLWLGGWVAWWVWKLKLMLNSAPIELKLELGLSLATTP